MCLSLSLSLDSQTFGTNIHSITVVVGPCRLLFSFIIMLYVVYVGESALFLFTLYFYRTHIQTHVQHSDRSNELARCCLLFNLNNGWLVSVSWATNRYSVATSHAHRSESYHQNEWFPIGLGNVDGMDEMMDNTMWVICSYPHAYIDNIPCPSEQPNSVHVCTTRTINRSTFSITGMQIPSTHTHTQLCDIHVRTRLEIARQRTQKVRQNEMS